MLFLRLAFFVLFVATCLLNSYLYFYPRLRVCHFPPISSTSYSASSSLRRGSAPSSAQAPFRLLALADPQLEGDTSLPFANADFYKPSILAQNLRNATSLTAHADVLWGAISDFFDSAVRAQLLKWRKQLDLFGNDYYLAHIYRSVYQYTSPTHVAVLGDLLGSQWIDDTEFDERASRFWSRVFRHGRRVEDAITGDATIETIGEDPAWSRRIINVAGNHDIGYAGDITPERLGRFERAFGRANWEIVFRISTASSARNMSEGKEEEEAAFLRLVVLNSMNLDTPAKDSDLQDATYNFLNDVISRSQPVEDRRVGTLLLTHIPLHKPAGVCADDPMIAYYDNDEGVKEQNHLSYDSSSGTVLHGVFGMSGMEGAPYSGLGRQGLILTGHDHEGCDVYHHLPLASAATESGSESSPSERRWNATPWEQAEEFRAQPIPGIREITLRSMMGEFGGWAYMISAWFEDESSPTDGAPSGIWRFEVARCAIGVQHWWWAGHVLMLITAGAGAALSAAAMFQNPTMSPVYTESKRLGHDADTSTEKRRRKGPPQAQQELIGTRKMEQNGHVNKISMKH